MFPVYNSSKLSIKLDIISFVRLKSFLYLSSSRLLLDLLIIDKFLLFIKIETLSSLIGLFEKSISSNSINLANKFSSRSVILLS